MRYKKVKEYMKKANTIDATQTVKQLATALQGIIDSRMETFMEHYESMRAISKQIEEYEKKMFDIITELEPVESLIYNQNPQLQKVFESLKRIYIQKEEDGVNREVNK